MHLNCFSYLLPQRDTPVSDNFFSFVVLFWNDITSNVHTFRLCLTFSFVYSIFTSYAVVQYSLIATFFLSFPRFILLPPRPRSLFLLSSLLILIEIVLFKAKLYIWYFYFDSNKLVKIIYLIFKKIISVLKVNIASLKIWNKKRLVDIPALGSSIQLIANKSISY